MKRTSTAAFIAVYSLLGAACGNEVGTGQRQTGSEQAALQVSGAQGRPFVIEPLRHDTSPPLRSLPQLPPNAAVPTEIPPPLNKPPPIALPPILPLVRDPVLQEITADAPAVEHLSTVNGISSTGRIPPDTNASVGVDQIVQTVNMAYQVFDKASGRSILGPSGIATIWSGFGGLCELNPAGDPIVLFDKAAGRWLITQMAQGATGYAECIAVSKTSDATGSFSRYAYDFGSLPDYPKFGVWPDAYYASFNNSTVACAYERSAMLAGRKAAAVCIPRPTEFSGILLPSDLDGSTPPPAGTPNFYVGASGTSGATLDSLSMYRFHVDFARPSNSTFTGPFPIPVAPFVNNSYLIPQLGTTQKLDGLQVMLSGRLAYRNFGDHESLVVCHSLLPGVRWYEFRNPAATPIVNQSGTFAPDSNIRFNCSAAMNGAGDIALGYSVTSSSMYPAIRITGRLAADPLGQMRAETSIIEGGGSQTNTTRWGDYSSMSVDPVDDATFVHANEFYAITSDGAWSTRIAMFKLNPFSTTGSMTASRFGHAAVLLPTGRVLVVGGSDASGAPLASADLYDPATGTFAPTGPMTTSRSTYTATLLPNGKVLVAGGYGPTGAGLATAEVYDPGTGAFTATGSMSTPRVSHSATVLPNGRVLIAGGSSDGANSLGTAELYDPLTGIFTSTGSMITARVTYVATLLPNGKVLFAGGYNASLGYLNTAELYDPATGTFSATVGRMISARHAYTETLLPNGKVLIAGGTTNGSNLGALTTAELYDPATGTFAATGSMTTARFYGSSLLRALLNGKVLVIGGRDSAATILASAEVYDPATGTFTKAGSGASTAHFRAPAVPLPNGKVLIAGGATALANAIATADLYDSGYPDGLGAFTATGSMGTARHAATAEPLPNGKVLVAGGSNSTGYLAGAELYDTAASTFTATGSMVAARVLHTSTLLPNGKVLIAGGLNQTAGSLISAELYDPGTGTFTTTGNMPSSRYNHSATLLSSGKILVVGGVGSSGTSPDAALYDPATGYFTATGSLITARYGHRATLPPSGKVLVVGGVGTSGTLASAELYDPATGTFTATGTMSNGRYLPTSTLVPGGKVLVAGGAIGTTYLATADLYDPATGTFVPTGSMASTRYFHTATLLPNGKVLVAGGSNASSVAGAELYDSATGTFAATGSLLASRGGQFATVLPISGRVLIAGGNSLGSYLASAELYQ